MENNMDTLRKLLEGFRDELNVPGLTEEDMQGIIDKAHQDTLTRAEELAAAQKNIALTDEQLQSVYAAKSSVETKAAAIAEEENSAKTAMDMARKMLEDASAVNSSASGETLDILKRATDALQNTLASAEELYTQKSAQRKLIDEEAVRINATEKAADYAACCASTAVAERMKEKLLAEKAAEIKIAEKETVDLRRQLADIRQETADACFGQKIDQYQAEVEKAEALMRENEENETRELAATAEQIDKERETCRAQVEGLQENIRSKTEEKDKYDAELVLARADALSTAENSSKASAEAASMEADLEQTTKNSEVEKADIFAAWDKELADMEQQVEESKSLYRQNNEALDNARTRLAQVRQDEEQLQLRSAAAVEEEQAARDAAEVARRLADNAGKVVGSISAESAELMQQAHDVLAASAKEAEELTARKHTVLEDVRNKCAEAAAQVTEAEGLAADAEQALTDAKTEWDNRETLLAQKKVDLDQKRVDYNRELDQKLQEAQGLVAIARNEAADKLEAAAQAKEKVRLLEENIQTLSQSIGECSEQITSLQSKADEVCATYEAASENRLSAIRIAKQNAADQADIQRKQLAEIKAAAAAAADKEEDMLRQVNDAENSVKSIIDNAVGQLQSAEAEVESRRATEREARSLSEELAAKAAALGGAVPQAAAAAQTEIIDEAAAPESDPAAVEAETPAAEAAAGAASLVGELIESPAQQQETAAETAAELEAPVIENAAEEVASVAEQVEAAAGEAVQDAVSLAAEEEKAAIRAAEEAEEAAIMRGLTGSIPTAINSSEKGSSEDYSAWLEMIDNEMVEKVMAEDGEPAAADTDPEKVAGWMSDLEKQVNAEEAAEEAAPAATAEEPAEDPAPAEEPPKKKHRFHFF